MPGNRLIDLLTEVELPLVPVVADLEEAGYRIDPEHFRQLADWLTGEQREPLHRLRQIAGEQFNPASPPQVAALLYQTLGLPVGGRTASGAPATDETTLRRLDDPSGSVAAILAYRERHKLLSTYCTLPDQADADGRPLDVDDLPADLVKVNAAGLDERPVWKVARRSPAGPELPQPAAVLFRLNRELAAELAGVRGAVHCTVLARELFALLRGFSCQPVGIRLTLVVLRQTKPRFVRRLGALLTGLGGDGEHRQRVVARLGELLGRLQEAGVVTGYQIDEGEDRLTVDRNPGWPAAG